MALAYDVVGPSSAGQTGSSPPSLTWSHTCSGTQRALVVFVAVGDVTSDASKTISSVTYAGVAMTATSMKHANDSSNGYIQAFTLKNPASGANNVVVTFASAPTSAEAGSLSFSGADQTTTFGAAVLAAGDSATASAAVASNTSGNIIAFGVVAGSSINPNPTSPATGRFLANKDAFSGGGNGAGATIPATGSSVTCSWGLTTTDWWAVIAIEVKAASGGASPQTVNPTGIASAEAFGVPAVAQAQTVSPTGIASAEAFGTPNVHPVTAVAPTGIASAEQFGVPSVQTSIAVSPTGIPSAQAFGNPVISGSIAVSPTGIPSAEAFGVPSVGAAPPGQSVTPTGIPSGFAAGVPVMSTQITVSPDGIASLEAFGAPVVSSLITVNPDGISTDEHFGLPTITGGLVGVMLDFEVTISSTRRRAAASTGTTRQKWEVGNSRGKWNVDDTRRGYTIGPTRKDR